MEIYVYETTNWATKFFIDAILLEEKVLNDIEKSKNMRIIITCGYNQSLHAISLISELKKRGHQLVGCIIVRTFQLKRLKIKIDVWLRDVLKKFQNAVLNSKNDFNRDLLHKTVYEKMKLISKK